MPNINNHDKNYTSPWIYELQRNRTANSITENSQAEIVIIGGGISGILTAESLLRMTDHNITLIEASQIAHGATGHNAGQLTTYFERPLRELVDEFGPTATYNTLHAIEHAHNDMQLIKEQYQITTPLYFFEGYTGIQSQSQLEYFIGQQEVRIEIGLEPWTMMGTQEFYDSCSIDLSRHPYLSITDLETISRLLASNNSVYQAIISEQKGCANSARFTEELASKLLQHYFARFTLYEHSPVSGIHFGNLATITTQGGFTIECNDVILCTNGFENFTMTSEHTPTLDTEFHTSITGLIGYMGAYIDHPVDSPTAISYLTNKEDSEDYYYLTRRPFAMHNNTTHNLISVGGPDDTLSEIMLYDAFTEIDSDVKTGIEDFLKKNYAPASQKDFAFSFLWHGLMGYTKNKIRMVGRDSREPHLIYNIGCNGVGILPAVVSAPRIAGMIRNEPLPVSIFDIKKA